MKLEEYLKAIDSCPDELLTSELGIQDNWPILMKADFNKILTDFENSNYTLNKIFERFGNSPIGIEIPRNADFKDKKITIYFNYNPGTIKVGLNNFFSAGLATLDITKQGSYHNQKQKNEFNMHLLLHPYQEKKIKNMNDDRAIAEVIKDISSYAQREDIPLCFPQSIGSAHKLDSDSLSRIIYFPKFNL